MPTFRVTNLNQFINACLEQPRSRMSVVVNRHGNKEIEVITEGAGRYGYFLRHDLKDILRTRDFNLMQAKKNHEVAQLLAEWRANEADTSPLKNFGHAVYSINGKNSARVFDRSILPRILPETKTRDPQYRDLPSENKPNADVDELYDIVRDQTAETDLLPHRVNQYLMTVKKWEKRVWGIDHNLDPLAKWGQFSESDNDSVSSLQLLNEAGRELLVFKDDLSDDNFDKAEKFVEVGRATLHKEVAQEPLPPLLGQEVTETDKPVASPNKMVQVIKSSGIQFQRLGEKPTADLIQDIKNQEKILGTYYKQLFGLGSQDIDTDDQADLVLESLPLDGKGNPIPLISRTVDEKTYIDTKKAWNKTRVALGIRHDEIINAVQRGVYNNIRLQSAQKRELIAEKQWISNILASDKFTEEMATKIANDKKPKKSAPQLPITDMFMTDAERDVKDNLTKILEKGMSQEHADSVETYAQERIKQMVVDRDGAFVTPRNLKTSAEVSDVKNRLNQAIYDQKNHIISKVRILASHVSHIKKPEEIVLEEVSIRKQVRVFELLVAQQQGFVNRHKELVAQEKSKAEVALAIKENAEAEEGVGDVAPIINMKAQLVDGKYVLTPIGGASRQSLPQASAPKLSVASEEETATWFKGDDTEEEQTDAFRLTTTMPAFMLIKQDEGLDLAKSQPADSLVRVRKPNSMKKPPRPDLIVEQLEASIANDHQTTMTEAHALLSNVADELDKLDANIEIDLDSIKLQLESSAKALDDSIEKQKASAQPEVPPPAHLDDLTPEAKALVSQSTVQTLKQLANGALVGKSDPEISFTQIITERLPFYRAILANETKKFKESLSSSMRTLYPIDPTTKLVKPVGDFDQRFTNLMDSFDKESAPLREAQTIVSLLEEIHIKHAHLERFIEQNERLDEEKEALEQTNDFFIDETNGYYYPVEQDGVVSYIPQQITDPQNLTAHIDRFVDLANQSTINDGKIEAIKQFTKLSDHDESYKATEHLANVILNGLYGEESKRTD